MSLLTKSKGAAIALAAAGLLGCSAYGNSAQVASASTDVKCFGVNKCKGFNDCKTSVNSCKGHGSCKGQGFVSMPQSSCDHLGGTTKS
jgi:uncharacterized membrane protein